MRYRFPCNHDNGVIALAWLDDQVYELLGFFVPALCFRHGFSFCCRERFVFFFTLVKMAKKNGPSPKVWFPQIESRIISLRFGGCFYRRQYRFANGHIGKSTWAYRQSHDISDYKKI
jgi:hypothetical protein